MAGSKASVVGGAAAAIALVLTSTACSGPDGEAKVGAGAGGTVPGQVPGAALTAARLESALLSQIPDYTPFGRPESGEYAALGSVRQGSQLQGAATLDKPECARSTQGFANDPRVRRAPAASVAFAKSSRLTVHQLLVAVPADLATAQVDYRVPKSCRTYGARIDDQSFTYRVVERGASAAAAGGQLGAGSRTVGVAVSTKSGGGAERQTKIWHVAFRDAGYIGFVTLSGALADRAEAEELARRAHTEAERTLP